MDEQQVPWYRQPVQVRYSRLYEGEQIRSFTVTVRGDVGAERFRQRAFRAFRERYFFTAESFAQTIKFDRFSEVADFQDAAVRVDVYWRH